MKFMSNRRPINPGFLLIVVALLFCGTTIQLRGEQEAQGLSPKEIHALLRRPDGLHIVAKKLGHFTFNRNPGGMPLGDSNYTWEDLVNNSNLIVDGVIVSQSSHVTDNGDLIDTTYTFAVINTLKGDASKAIGFVVDGGKVTFDDGTWAAVETFASDHLAANSEYLLFLRKNEDGLYVPVGTVEGLFELSWPNSTVTPLASFDGLPHRLLPEFFNQTPMSIITETKNKAAKQK